MEKVDQFETFMKSGHSGGYMEMEAGYLHLNLRGGIKARDKHFRISHRYQILDLLPGKQRSTLALVVCVILRAEARSSRQEDSFALLEVPVPSFSMGHSRL